MKYFIIAGEASGDLHGANLMKSLKESDPDAGFFFFGGDLMKAQGGILLKHYREMAFMGGIDVLRNLRKIRNNFNLCKKCLLEIKPDVLILIDYPGFNLKMAEFAHKNKITVFYFILPKVWAWKEWRVKALKSFVDELFSIFPFEVDFFRRHDLNVHYVGNPLLDAVSEAKTGFGTKSEFQKESNLTEKPIIALLPGSRVQEIRLMLPVMTRLANDHPGYQFVIAGASAIDKSLYDRYNCNPLVPLLFGQTYKLLSFAHAALVTSGTATLETALLNVPQLVLYKMAGGKIAYKIFRYLFLMVKFISLPNLILDQQAVREFVMHEMNYGNIKPETDKLLNDNAYRKKIFEMYDQLMIRMGTTGASSRAADQMIRIMRTKNVSL